MNKIEVELNRGWIKDEDGEDIGETNFVVSLEFIVKMYKEKFQEQYDNFADFFDWYEPETDGQFMYEQAKATGELIMDVGVVMF